MRIGASSPPVLLSRYPQSTRRSTTASTLATRLLVETSFAKGVLVSGKLPAIGSSFASREADEQNPAAVLSRINALIESIQQQALAGAKHSGNGPALGGAGSEQRAIDAALLEIADLVGTPLRLGGAEQAVVSGLNEAQIDSYEVLTLRPNASLTLSGSLLSPGKRATSVAAFSNRLGALQIVTDVAGLNENQIAALNTGSLSTGTVTNISGSVDVPFSPAELLYAGSPGSVVSGTASFRLTGPQGSANFSITAGEALAEVADRINDQTAATGVVAEVQGDSLGLSTIATGAAATIVIDNIDRESIISVSGVNGSQVDDFDVVSIPDETEITLNGSVTQAATRATLTYLGANGGVVVDSATFVITGDLGSAPISIVQGESLAEVASRINQQTQATGVTAAVSGDDLILSSVEFGSQADLAVELDEIQQYISVSGVDASQITNFQVVSADPDSVNTLSGSVTQAATPAQLTYSGGFGGLITASATFTLTGSVGSANISVTFLETLTAVRDRINQQTGTTGVTASVSGNQLFLTSNGVGTAATVAVNVTSGTFNVTGGNGNGTANGTNAQLQINGQPVTAIGNNVAFTDSLGSYTFTLVNGFTGAFDTITVTSANGTFDITGGNGDATANGSNALATIDGQPLVAAGRIFTINSGGGQFQIEVADGFTGAVDTIVVTSAFADFTITGGNGDATANGTDAQATINGQTLNSGNGIFTVATAAGNVVIDFDDSFLGEFDPLTITVREEPLLGANSVSHPTRGRPATAIINGQKLTAQSGRFVVNQNGVQVALKFANGFRGKFDSIRISGAADVNGQPKKSPLSNADLKQLRPLLAPLFSLASGGESADLRNNGGRVFRLAESVRNDLAEFRFGRWNVRTPRSLRSSSALLDLLA